MSSGEVGVSAYLSEKMIDVGDTKAMTNVLTMLGERLDRAGSHPKNISWTHHKLGKECLTDDFLNENPEYEPHPHWHLDMFGMPDPAWSAPMPAMLNVLPGTKSSPQFFAMNWDQTRPDASWEIVNETCTPGTPCVFHPVDTNGTHGGAPHIHPCEAHRG